MADDVEYDDGGLPVHLYIGVNRMGQGPVSDEEAHEIICWCRDGRECSNHPPLKHWRP